MGCADYAMLEKSAGMATTVRVPRERQFHVVPLPGAFTRGRWKCRDYRKNDHMDSRNQILDFTDHREREKVGAVAKRSVAPCELRVNNVTLSIVREGSTIVVTSIVPPPPAPQRNTHHVEATERAIRELERGNPTKAIGTRLLPSHSLSSSALVIPTSTQVTTAQGGALTGGSSPGEDEVLTSGCAAPLSTPSVVAIDNKIEQAMDLVKTHLTFAVREEVDVLRQTIAELEQKVSSLESENHVLRQYAPGEVLSTLIQQRKNSANPALSSIQQHAAPAAPPKK